MSKAEIAAFLTHLAVQGRSPLQRRIRHSVSLLFLYREVLKMDVTVIDIVATIKSTDDAPCIVSDATIL
jgi:hypothetical protein